MTCHNHETKKNHQPTKKKEFLLRNTPSTRLERSRRTKLVKKERKKGNAEIELDPVEDPT